MWYNNRNIQWIPESYHWICHQVHTVELRCANAYRERLQRELDEQLEKDALFGGKDWSDLAVLFNSDSQLGQAVRMAQKYFSDEEIVAALVGRSREVTLTVIDGAPAFVNAAMLAEVMTGTLIEPPVPEAG